MFAVRSLRDSYKSKIVLKLKEKIKEHMSFLASFIITEEDVPAIFATKIRIWSSRIDGISLCRIVSY